MELKDQAMDKSIDSLLRQYLERLGWECVDEWHSQSHMMVFQKRGGADDEDLEVFIEIRPAS